MSAVLVAATSLVVMLNCWSADLRSWAENQVVKRVAGVGGMVWCTFNIDTAGNVTIQDQYTATGTISFSDGGTASLDINNTGADKKFYGYVRRVHSPTGVYGVPY